MNNIIAKPAVQYGSETWVVREEGNGRIESETRFLRPLLGILLMKKREVLI
jgi:hypothetical protein